MDYHTLSKITVFTVIGLLLAGASIATRADATTDPEPLALRRIMQDLGRNMQSAADGISREDWVLTEVTAQLISGHPEPPIAEKVRILSFIGSDAGKFRGYDRKVVDAARLMAQASREMDGEAVINAFHALQTSCFDCHRTFREPFLEHFYGRE